jgi:hypothetical protein
MFDAGQDVVVTFDGEDCPGEVIESKHGWILAKILIDAASDHGQISSNLSPVSQVIVRESEVRVVK